ncbi:hypothetical protein JCM19039_1877 [Geomicrobium sp. JCM 19039]|nr:hypothetical protein JCM19039_1877 [Geomicrobium sp. JCM 19039]
MTAGYTHQTDHTYRQQPATLHAIHLVGIFLMFSLILAQLMKENYLFSWKDSV